MDYLKCPLCGADWNADRLDGLLRHLDRAHGRTDLDVSVRDGVAVVSSTPFSRSPVVEPRLLSEDPGTSWEPVGGKHVVEQRRAS